MAKIRKECKEPWFSFLKSGEKIFEGRVRKHFWNKVKEEDVFTIFCGNEEFDVVVTEIIYFDDFREMYKKLGEKLLPGVKSEDECWKVYNQFNNDLVISKNGTVAVGIEI